jgi:hypothetical protein
VLEDGASIKARGKSAPSSTPFSSFCLHRASCIPQIIPIPFYSQGSETVDWKKQGEAKCFRGECTMCVAVWEMAGISASLLLKSRARNSCALDR